eukprot:COSAG02_NODE_413_length_22830_cov_57.043597_3_plen_85_part_00
MPDDPAISAPCVGPPHPATVVVKSKRAVLASPYGVPKELATTVATGYEYAVRRIELMLDRENTKQGAGFVVFERKMYSANYMRG